jgi:hypothetical protein
MTQATQNTAPKLYDVEAECRPAGAQGVYEMKWFYRVPCDEMTTDAGIIGIHAATGSAWEIQRVRTICSMQDD